MQTVRAAVLGVAGTILAVAIVTGPLGPLGIPVIQGETAAPGTGEATVSVVAQPDAPSLDRARQSEDAYYLRVPDVVTDVDDLRGNPTLTYTVSIRELGYSRSSVHFIGDAGEGRLAVSLERDTFPADEITQGAYDAKLELVIRSDVGARTVYDDTATVEVVG